jgi:hypothetical protein
VKGDAIDNSSKVKLKAFCLFTSLKWVCWAEGFLIAYSASSKPSFEAVTELYNQLVRIRKGAGFSSLLVATQGTGRKQRNSY